MYIHIFRILLYRGEKKAQCIGGFRINYPCIYEHEIKVKLFLDKVL